MLFTRPLSTPNSRPRGAISWIGLGALLVLLWSGLTGCWLAHEDVQGTRVRLDDFPLIPNDKKSPKGEYLSFTGRGKDEPRFGFLKFGYEMFAPSHAEVTTGGFDPKKLDELPGQRGCIELDTTASVPLEFSFICADHLGSQWSVFAGWDINGNQDLNRPVTNFSITDRIQLRITVDDQSNIEFSAKLPNDVSWTLVDSVTGATHGEDFTTQSVLPSVGVNGLGKKGDMGFAWYQGFSAPRPNPTTEEEIYDLLWQSAMYGMSACDNISSVWPSEIDILNDIGDSRNRLTDAISLAQGLPADKDIDKAVKNMLKQVGSLDKAADKVNDGKLKNAGSAVGKSLKGMEKSAMPFIPGQVLLSVSF